MPGAHLGDPGSIPDIGTMFSSISALIKKKEPKLKLYNVTLVAMDYALQNT